VRLSRVGAWWCTFLFGCFYLAYKEAWLHAGIALVLMLFIGPLAWLGWFAYAFFAYWIIVDTSAARAGSRSRGPRSMGPRR
jgi:hypothetical protein